MLFHLPSILVRSESNSATFLPFATVRIITPKPLGLILELNVLTSFQPNLLSFEIQIHDLKKEPKLKPSAIDSSEVSVL